MFMPNQIILLCIIMFIKQNGTSHLTFISRNVRSEFFNKLTSLPRMSLLENSPLNEKVPEAVKLLKKVPSMQEYIKTTSSIKKPPVSKDKPLTFQSKIKSSGYSRPGVKRDKFTPLINKSRSLSIPNLASNSSSKSKSPPLVKPEFQFELPIYLDKKLNTG